MVIPWPQVSVLAGGRTDPVATGEHVQLPDWSVSEILTMACRSGASSQVALVTEFRQVEIVTIRYLDAPRISLVLHHASTVSELKVSVGGPFDAQQRVGGEAFSDSFRKL